MALSHSCSVRPCRLHNLHFKATSQCFPSFFSSITHSDTHTPHLHVSTPNPNSDLQNAILFNYLMDSFGLSKAGAHNVCNRVKNTIKPHEKLQSVVDLFKSLGFSDEHIRSLVRGSPQVLFSDIEKILKPKLQFFQELGLSGSDLGKFLAQNKVLLNRSLDKKLRPCVESLKKILPKNDLDKHFIQILRRFYWGASMYCESRFLSNMTYLKSCGITSAQLSALLVKCPMLFTNHESELKDIVSRVLDMGFSIKSPTFCHAIFAINSMRIETFNRKLNVFESFGFSEAEFMSMFQRQPALLTQLEEKIKLVIEFYMNTIKLGKAVIVRNPVIMMYSMKDRVIPRYKLLQILMSKGLLKKEPSFPYVLHMPEKKFTDKFISRFTYESKELLVAYKSNITDPSEE